MKAARTFIAEAKIDYDRRLIALMDRMRCGWKTIKLNPAKLRFKLQEVKFMGHITSNNCNGMKPDPDKIDAITRNPMPKNKGYILRIIGML